MKPLAEEKTNEDEDLKKIDKYLECVEFYRKKLANSGLFTAKKAFDVSIFSHRVFNFFFF